MSDLDDTYLVELHLDFVKYEHVPHVLRLLQQVERSLSVDDGMAIDAFLSVVKNNGDGVERWVEFVDDDGEIIAAVPGLRS